MGRRLIARLLKSEYQVRALTRMGSEFKLPSGCIPVISDPFNATAFASSIDECSTFIQLLGVSHPGPAKKDLFDKIDFASAAASAAAAKQANCSHFIYVSVAQTPTSIMHDYQQCCAKCEKLIMESSLKVSIIRPWYVIGPGHYWPLLFLPLSKFLEIIPATSAKAKALRLVYLRQMLDMLCYAIEHPPIQQQVFEIKDIRMNRKAR